MSGGHFDYEQFKIQCISDTIKSIISQNKVKIPEKEKDQYTNNEFYYDYKEEVINKFKEAVDYLDKAYIYAQRIDWLLSGDDGEDSFLERLEEELNKLKNNNNSNNNEKYSGN